jgi:hypothetical protein
MDKSRLALLKRQPQLADSFDIEALIERIETLERIKLHRPAKVTTYERSPHVLACTPVEKIYEMAGTVVNPTPISLIMKAFPNAKRGTLSVTLCRMYKNGLIGSTGVYGPEGNQRGIFKIPGSVAPVSRGLRSLI